MISVITLIIVFLLIAVRQIGKLRIKIWHSMLLGALVVLVTGQISLSTAVKSIDPDVMLFLFGIFIVGQALEDSGYLSYLSFKYFSRVKSLSGLIFVILYGIGLLSAVLMNDTLAIIGTPVMLMLARHTGVNPRLLLISLAIAVTTGSAISPIGNPQNLLIAVHGNITNPFVTFVSHLLLPALLSLLTAYLFIRLFYRQYFRIPLKPYQEKPVKDRHLTILVRISLILLLLMIMVKIIFSVLDVPHNLSITYIALIAALPVLIGSPQRLLIVRRIDWATLVFFISMFILMRSVWDTGIFQKIIAYVNSDLTGTFTILAVSSVLSQLISNVPLVALYLPMITGAGAGITGMLALAAGSTIAGNLTILGAASNIIIIQNAEKKGESCITFLEFARIGIPLTAVQIAIFWLFLSIW